MFTMFFKIISSLIIAVFIKNIRLDYAGDNFPVKYMHPDGNYAPSISDIQLYLSKLTDVANYMHNNMNSSDVSQAITTFLTAAVLKRTLKDHDNDVKKYENNIKSAIHHLDIITDRYKYIENHGKWRDKHYRISKAMQDDASTVISLGNFKRGVLREYLTNSIPINDIVKSMDYLTLPKEDYVELAMDLNNDYEMSDSSSELCLSRLVENIDVLDNITLHPCKRDNVCRKKIFTGSSVAYSLNRRLFNNIMYLHTRRCYHYSPTFDISHMDMLCAAMYREAVYIARKGYFDRHIFMEQVGLCGLLGHEEFYRRAWFHKIASWVDKNGCLKDNYNFMLNRTKVITTSFTNKAHIREIWRMHEALILEDCQLHLMAVAMLAFANGVRHAAQYQKSMHE